MSVRPAHLPGATIALAVLACGTGPVEPGKLGPDDFCGAMCQLAADCAAADHGADQGADQGADAADLQAACEAAVAAVPGCGAADTADAAERAACTAALDARRAEGSCAAFVGNSEVNVLDVGPAECAVVDDFALAWDAAMTSVAVDGAQLCAELAAAHCARLDSCVTWTDGFDPAAGEAPPDAACAEALAPLVEACVNDGALTYRLAGNPLRDGAEACVAALNEEAVPCADLLTGSPPAACADAFANVREASSYAAALSTVAADYAVAR